MRRALFPHLPRKQCPREAMVCTSQRAVPLSICLIVILGHAQGCQSVSDGPGMQEDLAELNSNLTYAAYVRPTNATDWINQCAYYFKLGGFQLEGGMNPKYSTYYLRDKPSGLCTLRLSAGLKDMAWSIPIQEVFAWNDLLRVSMPEIEGDLPPLELPDLMSFPQTARDVAEIAKFADMHGLEVSIKNSGHSYSGQSTRGRSLQVNMRSYPKYSATEIVECQEVSGNSRWSAACALATARGKKAVIRVGGGESNDDIQRHLSSWNYALPREQMYDALTGAEGIVGMGWLFGGGLGMGQEREWGIGVDQVLEIEMVLPDGRHVKIGPSEWEDKEGFLYPQTTAVKGYCNARVHHLEQEWEWKECQVGKNSTWEDLWFAVRGGGGGTFGIVLSVIYQLHEMEEYYALASPVAGLEALNQTCRSNGDNCTDVFTSLKSVWADFLITYLWDPSSLNVSQDLSNMCGYSNAAFDITRTQSFLIICRSSEADKSMIEAWNAYIPTSKYMQVASLSTSTYVPLFRGMIVSCRFTGGTFSRSMIGVTANAVPLAVCTYMGDIGQSTNNGSPLLALSSRYGELFTTPTGHLLDSSGPGTYQPYSWSVLLPQELIIKYNRDFMVNFFGFQFDYSHHVMGGRIAMSGDGMDSLPDSLRQAGVQIVLLQPSSNFTEVDEFYSFYSSLVLRYLGVNSATRDFPGYTEINHQGGWGAGPLKSDWNTSCPLAYSAEERTSKCMTIQETQHGTRKWKKLQQIKSNLDPQMLYNVRYGIGNTDSTPSPPPYATSALTLPDIQSGATGSATNDGTGRSLLWSGIDQ